MCTDIFTFYLKDVFLSQFKPLMWIICWYLWNRLETLIWFKCRLSTYARWKDWHNVYTLILWGIHIWMIIYLFISISFLLIITKVFSYVLMTVLILTPLKLIFTYLLCFLRVIQDCHGDSQSVAFLQPELHGVEVRDCGEESGQRTVCGHGLHAASRLHFRFQRLRSRTEVRAWTTLDLQASRNIRIQVFP